MITFADLARSFIMTGRLLRLDYSAALLTPRNGEWAWSSMRVWALLLPLVLVTSWPESPELFQKTGLNEITFSLIVMLQTAIAVLGFFLVVAHITRRIGIPERFAHYVSVQNWGALPVWLVLAILVQVSRLYYPGALQGSDSEFILRLFLLYYSFIMTRATLGLRPLATLVLCLLELFFGHFIQYTTAYLLALTLLPR
jgi:hypothetical protein